MPSKVLGPLVVYANNANETKNASTSPDPLKHVKKPLVSIDENPFYHKDNKKEGHVSKPVITTEPSQGLTSESPAFLGPFNPNFPLSSKGNKGSKNNPKVKTKPASSDPNIKSQVPDQTTPPHQPLHLPGKGPPEELLHIISQHPDLANYPPGSILEIHNVPNGNRPNHPFLNPNSIVPQHPNMRQPQPQIVPYITPDHQGRPLSNGLPPGVTLEQILQEIHKTEQSHQFGIPFVPYQQNQHYPENNNGQIFIAQQSGPVIPTRPNATYPGGWCFLICQKRSRKLQRV